MGLSARRISPIGSHLKGTTMPDAIFHSRPTDHRTRPELNESTSTVDLRFVPATRKDTEKLFADIHTAANEIDSEIYWIGLGKGVIYRAQESLESLEKEIPASIVRRELETLSDTVSYVMADFTRRLQAIDEAAHLIAHAAGSLRPQPGASLADDMSEDPVEGIWRAALETEAAYEAAANVDDNIDLKGQSPQSEQAVAAMEVAAESLVQHRTTTPLGILRKLQFIAEVECLEKPERAATYEARVIIGLIRDLKLKLGVA